LVLKVLLDHKALLEVMVKSAQSAQLVLQVISDLRVLLAQLVLKVLLVQSALVVLLVQSVQSVQLVL
jgi:hypothetical protein